MSVGLGARPSPTTSYQLAALTATQSRAQSGERAARRPQRPHNIPRGGSPQTGMSHTLQRSQRDLGEEEAPGPKTRERGCQACALAGN